MVNGVSLFSNVGIGETYFEEYGLNICGANEIIEKRAKFYRHLYPDSNMICGDITKKEIFDKLIDIYQRNNCDFLISTPPCQGMSQAGKMDKDDPRNSLIIQTINFIKETRPSNVIIEN
ncbi:DNA cytosine methyltransferase [Methanosphaera sp. WGK6]|uniref:DNA cytosine methyltransferase n=1 Tax=Methanosphaera sp. WGK6 TaxID=1561964 RepID=UPI00084C159A|nr:DNA cytosine methyltransferase [Methanosphaera sp. WGK6]